MSLNWASVENGCRIVDFSSEIEGCEAANVLEALHSSIWLTESGLGLPQWICLSLVDSTYGHNEALVLRTLGWRCQHPYSTNPKTVAIHVSQDGQKFKVWDTLAAPLLKGTQLFTIAPISAAIYPYIAFEITETHGGSQTYMNRIFFYADEVPPSPAAAPRRSSVATATATATVGRGTFDGARSETKRAFREASPPWDLLQATSPPWELANLTEAQSEEEGQGQGQGQEQEQGQGQEPAEHASELKDGDREQSEEREPEGALEESLSLHLRYPHFGDASFDSVLLGDRAGDSAGDGEGEGDANSDTDAELTYVGHGQGQGVSFSQESQGGPYELGCGCGLLPLAIESRPPPRQTQKQTQKQRSATPPPPECNPFSFVDSDAPAVQAQVQAQDTAGALWHARVTELEAASVRLLTQLADLQLRMEVPALAPAAAPGLAAAESPAVLREREEVIHDLDRTVRSTLRRVEERHDALIQGFRVGVASQPSVRDSSRRSVLRGSELSEGGFAPRLSGSAGPLSLVLPPPLDLEALRKRHGLDAPGTAARDSSTSKKTAPPLPLPRARSRGPRRTKAAPAPAARVPASAAVPSAIDPVADPELALLAHQLHAAVERRALKEEQLRLLLRARARSPDYLAGAGMGTKTKASQENISENVGASRRLPWRDHPARPKVDTRWQHASRR